MQHDLFSAVGSLSDEALLQGAHRLAHEGRRSTAELIVHIAYVEARDLHLKRAHSSTFAWCRQELLLSESEAYHRITAARLARRLPVVLELLENGSINLTSLRILGPHLTAENAPEVLARARGASKLDVERIAAGLAPKPLVPTTVRRVPPPVVAVSTSAPLTPATVSAAAASPPPPAPPPAHRPAAALQALTSDHFKLQITVTAAAVEKLRCLRDVMSHGRADDAALLERALDALLEKELKRRFAVTGRPRAARTFHLHTRRVPAHMARSLFVRDTGRCCFTTPDGRRCTETRGLQIHHKDPWINGGGMTLDNLELRCAAHNRYEARVFARTVNSLRSELELLEEGGARTAPAPVLRARWPAGRTPGASRAGRGAPP